MPPGACQLCQLFLPPPFVVHSALLLHVLHTMTDVCLLNPSKYLQFIGMAWHTHGCNTWLPCYLVSPQSRRTFMLKVSISRPGLFPRCIQDYFVQEKESRVRVPPSLPRWLAFPSYRIYTDFLVSWFLTHKEVWWESSQTAWSLPLIFMVTFNFERRKNKPSPFPCSLVQRKIVLIGIASLN